MSEPSAPEQALAAITSDLLRFDRQFALIGGLAVSVRGEVRFTRDVDLVVLVADDEDAEGLIFDLRSSGYAPVATVEHKRHSRLATARLASATGIVVDLMFANCGIEREIVTRATPVELDFIGAVPVAASEELVAMKVLSMTERRLQDGLDVQRILQSAPSIDLERVRANLLLIAEREYDRGQDLQAKLATVLAALEDD